MIKIPRLSEIFPALTYRWPMRVWQLMVFSNARNEDSYYVCPRCGITMEREFMDYCDRCGQCLDWTMHAQAKVIYPGRQKRGVKAKCPDPNTSNVRF